MYDFKNGKYYCSGNLAQAGCNYGFVSADSFTQNKNANPKVLNFPSRTRKNTKAMARKKATFYFLKLFCKAIIFFTVFSILFLIFSNLPQVLDSLTKIVINFFEFIFRVVEIIFSLAFTIAFFFLAGAFMK